jgi:TRAP-type C4-dicarboxylate transport system substrate-binding protein
MFEKELVENVIRSMVSQCIIERENNWKQLPTDQQKALEQILEAVETIKRNRDKILPEYQKQAVEAFILKAVSEFGWDRQ